MSGTWGNKIQLTIFGESHGSGIGFTLCGVPSGTVIDEEFIANNLLRRAGGHDKLSTTRKESDPFTFFSGVLNGRAEGTPICCIIPNENTRSKDYDKIKNYMRPSHADYTGYVKYNGFNDYRGGGHFSGRITAAFVAAGSIAKIWLKDKGITIGAHIASIGGINDDSFDVIDENLLTSLSQKKFAVINDEKGIEMQNIILSAKADLDSVGGTVECATIGLPVGIGDPFFDSAESVLSHLLFSIPAIKGVEFGLGFQLASMRGSEANDEMYAEGDRIITKTNHSGGINGGITNGMPLTLRVAFRPTPSIAKPQNTVDISTMENINYSIEGRHDPCIVQRGLVVVESAVALGIMDMML